MGSEKYYTDKAEAIKRFTQSLETLNREIAIESINFFKRSFDNQGFTDNTLVPWRRTKSGKQNKFGVKSSGILIQSGELKDSFDYKINGTIITVINTAAHAPAHNAGMIIKHPGGTSFFKDEDNDLVFVSKRKANELKTLRGLKLPKTKAHDIPIPKRQFMGRSTQLDNIIAKLIIKKFIKSIYG